MISEIRAPWEINIARRHRNASWKGGKMFSQTHNEAIPQDLPLLIGCHTTNWNISDHRAKVWAPSHEWLTQHCSRSHGPKTSVAKVLALAEYQETQPQHVDRSISSYFKSKQNLVGYEHTVHLRYAGAWCTWSRLTTLHILHQGQCSCYLWLHLIVQFKEYASFKLKKTPQLNQCSESSEWRTPFESLCNNRAFYLLTCLVYSQTITHVQKLPKFTSLTAH